MNRTLSRRIIHDQYAIHIRMEVRSRWHCPHSPNLPLKLPKNRGYTVKRSDLDIEQLSGCEIEELVVVPHAVRSGNDAIPRVIDRRSVQKVK